MGKINTWKIYSKNKQQIFTPDFISIFTVIEFFYQYTDSWHSLTEWLKLIKYLSFNFNFVTA